MFLIFKEVVEANEFDMNWNLCSFYNNFPLVVIISKHKIILFISFDLGLKSRQKNKSLLGKKISSIFYMVLLAFM
jgi:hypothetical protein